MYRRGPGDLPSTPAGGETDEGRGTGELCAPAGLGCAKGPPTTGSTCHMKRPGGKSWGMAAGWAALGTVPRGYLLSQAHLTNLPLHRKLSILSTEEQTHPQTQAYNFTPKFKRDLG